MTATGQPAAGQAVIVEADGGSRGNPGPAGFGAVVIDADTGAVLGERSESIGIETNNVAEYRGLIAGLSAAAELGADRVRVRMDSKLVVEQMNGNWQVKHPGLRELARAAAALRARFDAVTFEWIPRERNKHADRLANAAMDRAAGKTPRPEQPAGAQSSDTRSSAVRSSSGQSSTGQSSTGQSSTGQSSTAPPALRWEPPIGQPTRLVLIRHGSTTHSAAKALSGRNDLPLNAPGEQQAADLAARDYGAVAAVVSSPLRRAVQTAQAIATARGLTVEVVDGLAELDFGEWEGLTMAQARERDPAAVEAWLGSPDVAPPGGESFATLGRRVRAAREQVLAAHPESVVLVVSHVTPIKTLIRFALDAPPQAMYRLYLDVASVSTLDYFADGSSSVRLVNDTSHLAR